MMQHDPHDCFAIESPGSSFDTLSPRRQPFVEKLSFILEDEENRDLIDWSFCGDFFRISDSDEFARTVLPRYFRHSNWTSFVRQLNMYDFHKLHENNDQWSPSSSRPTNVWDFKHEKFYRGATAQQLSQIKRKKPRDHAALHIHYADTMQMTNLQVPPSPPLIARTPFIPDYNLFNRLERRLDGLSTSFDALIEELTELRTMIDKQNKTMSRMLPLVENIAESRTSNMQPWTRNPPNSSPVPMKGSDHQKYKTPWGNPYHVINGAWGQQRCTVLRDSKEGREEAAGSFSQPRQKKRKRKLRDGSAGNETNQQRKRSEDYSFAFILNH